MNFVVTITLGLVVDIILFHDIEFDMAILVSGILEDLRDPVISLTHERIAHISLNITA